jgi:hypothetical protein
MPVSIIFLQTFYTCQSSNLGPLVSILGLISALFFRILVDEVHLNLMKLSGILSTMAPILCFNVSFCSLLLVCMILQFRFFSDVDFLFFIYKYVILLIKRRGLQREYTSEPLIGRNIK